MSPASQARSRRARRDRRSPLILAALGSVGLVAGVLAAGEVFSARAARAERAQLEGPYPDRARPDEGPTGDLGGLREVMVVLGYGNPGRRINAVNRWRVDVGLRSRDPQATSSLLVMAGGAVHGEVSEAEHMARFARSERGYAGPLVLEDESVTTWENVRNVLPLLEDADRIVLASDPLHSVRAEGFLRTLRPDLAARLAPAEGNRLGEQILRKPAFVVMGLEGLRRARRDGLMA
ncbi:YdcF family protein [Brachybacterium halotolerans subsp. kimchii]|uniref:YdcF family protein n=1 Tax=Brachybacterium halotolerans TaxID=2795215 RepID=UPI001E2C58F3|nr:YdcF family protein [Brachybacterium halotolerans]UEJ81944.1 YdcF family protein [Brachybacterium halotolerans subsp. kimchii]